MCAFAFDLIVERLVGSVQRIHYIAPDMLIKSM